MEIRNIPTRVKAAAADLSVDPLGKRREASQTKICSRCVERSRVAEPKWLEAKVPISIRGSPPHQLPISLGIK